MPGHGYEVTGDHLGGSIMGAKMRTTSAAKRQRAGHKVDRAEACAWSVQMEGYGGPAQPSLTIGQCLNGGLGWLQARRMLPTAHH
jgi:hypothetical protein